MARPKAVSLNPVCLLRRIRVIAAPFQDILWCVDCFCQRDSHLCDIRRFPGGPGSCAGCRTIPLLAPYQKGQRVLDVDGDPVHREFRRGWLRLTRTKPVAAALQLPGSHARCDPRRKSQFRSGAHGPQLAR